VPLDRAESKLLFQVISDCYKQRSVIITTNLEFSKWINVFHDEQMTAAMIDRLGHHSYLLLLDGRSYRIKDLLMREHSHNSLERCCKTSLQEQGKRTCQKQNAVSWAFPHCSRAY